MKKVSRKSLGIIVTVLVIGIVILSIYLLKPWIPSKYRDPLFCDENVDCRLDYVFGEFSCVNKYHYSGGLDNTWLLSGPSCYCNISESRCVLISYSPFKYYEEVYRERQAEDAACRNLISSGCNVSTDSIIMENFDANNDSIIDSNDTLLEFCKVHYKVEILQNYTNLTPDDLCKRYCDC